jgi:heterodisulfide reductase subunit B
MPVYFFTELMGLAFGLSPKELWLDKHLTDALPLLKTKGLT